MSKLPQIGNKEARHTFIQWKGTNVCMDIWCPECEFQMHADSDFFYYFVCPQCNTTFEVGTEVKLTKLTGDKEKEARSLSCCYLFDKDSGFMTGEVTG